MAASHAKLEGVKVDMQRIRCALISVSDKSDLQSLVECLNKHNVKILSTGGTAKKIRSMNIPVVDVSEHTGSPEILNGRVKTLHPKIHGALLSVRGNKVHESELKQHEIEEIDLVVCNLYPFSETVAAGADFDTCIENIDIGGPSMIRSAAKNHRAVTVATSVSQYKELIEQLTSYNGCTEYTFRRRLAFEAFRTTAKYDESIRAWFAGKRAVCGDRDTVWIKI